MLKIVKTSVAIASASLLFAGNAHADINSALQNICTIVKADDKSELRKKMKKVQSDYRLKLQDYYNGVSCGGNSLIRTAFLNNFTIFNMVILSQFIFVQMIVLSTARI